MGGGSDGGAAGSIVKRKQQNTTILRLGQIFIKFFLRGVVGLKGLNIGSKCRRPRCTFKYSCFSSQLPLLAFVCLLLSSIFSDKFVHGPRARRLRSSRQNKNICVRADLMLQWVKSSCSQWCLTKLDTMQSLLNGVGGVCQNADAHDSNTDPCTDPLVFPSRSTDP